MSEEPVVSAVEEVAGKAALFTAEQLADFVRVQLEKERQAHASQMSAVKAQLDALAASVSGQVPSLIREHGGGLGTEIHETWSQFEQERAYRNDEAKRELAASA